MAIFFSYIIGYERIIEKKKKTQEMKVCFMVG